MVIWKIVGGAPIDQITLRQVDYAYNILAQAGRLDWSGIYDQVVFVIGSNEFSCTFEQITREFVGVITFNDSKMALAGTVGKDGECQGTNQQWPWVNGLALGHFASIADDTTSDSAFDQQIGTLLNDGSVRIYEVSPPASWTPSLVSQTTTDSSLAINFLPNLPPGPHLPNWLVSGDLQGRSARLGAPSVVRVASHSQPSVILGAPPMHVDYILPDQSTATDWEVVNFSTVPDTFNSSYTMSQTNSNQSSDTNRTSYTYATSEQGGASFSFKLPYLPSVSGSIKTTTENKNEAVSETYQFTQNEFTYDASTTTGLGDEIWYGVSSFNVYYYPVLGETVCPADNSGCDPSEEQQLYVTFSGPSSTGTGPGPGANTEWYQPVHEPGNLFLLSLEQEPA